jgi:hypothetical protein
MAIPEDYRFWIAVGFMYALFRVMRKDINGIGIFARKEKDRNERRWKHEMANEIEELEPKDKSARLAKRLREDAWRD